MNETIELCGSLTIELADHAGRVLTRRRYANHIVVTGRRLVAEFFSGVAAGAPPAPVTHMAVGTDPTPPSDGDPALFAQRGARKPISNATVTEIVQDGVTRVQVALETVFDFGEANDPGVPLREAAIFNAATGGVMYNRVVFEPVTKTDAFRLTLFWDVVF